MEEANIDDYNTAKHILDEIVSALNKIETFNLQKKFLKEIESDILATNNLELFYKMCTEGNLPYNVELIKPYIEAILNSKDAKFNYRVSEHVRGVDKKAHAKVVLESKDPEYNYLFARNIVGANKKAHARVVIQSKDPGYNYRFVTFMGDKINKTPHIKAVIESKNLEYNYLLLENSTTKRNFIKHSRVILDSKDSEYNYKVARYIRKNLNSGNKWEEKSIKLFVQKIEKKHLKVLLENNDIYSVYEFVYTMNDLELEEYSKKILESKNLHYNYNFANRKRINVLKHGQVILDSQDLEYNYLFASNVIGANVLAHGKVIIESKNLEYNYKFAKYVKDADIDAHRLVILEAQKRNHLEEDERIIIDNFLREFPGTDYSTEVMNVKSLIKKYNNNNN